MIEQFSLEFISRLSGRASSGEERRDQHLRRGRDASAQFVFSGDNRGGERAYGM